MKAALATILLAFITLTLTNAVYKRQDSSYVLCAIVCALFVAAGVAFSLFVAWCLGIIG